MKKLSTAQCLANYIQDLEYQIVDLDDLGHSCGIGVNFVTCGTPEFESVDAAWDYVAAVKQTYFELTGTTYGDESC
jgi:hypothetical protein